MARNDATSAVIDNILKVLLVSGTLTVSLAVPNALVALDKPLAKALKHLDKRSRDREARRLLGYMKSQNLITENYQHGISLTDKGKQRLEMAKFNNISIAPAKHWDKLWRMVMFDIPETKKNKRKALTSKLSQLGFYPLQRSVWLHPLPCRKEIETISTYYGLNRYISYIEVLQIDNQKVLLKRFQKKLPATKFK